MCRSDGDAKEHNGLVYVAKEVANLCTDLSVRQSRDGKLLAFLTNLT